MYLTDIYRNILAKRGIPLAVILIKLITQLMRNYIYPALLVLLRTVAWQHNFLLVTFVKQGADALEKELRMEMLRISERNLGRDDRFVLCILVKPYLVPPPYRIISDHGREARFPYLDERVVEFLRDLPLNLKADLSLPRGVGEKLLLRQVAIKLGLAKAATLPKRAMQFGSRIAKAEGGARLCGAADRLPSIHLN
ncbi:uncharacterized protein DEA37_0008457 [Paragonimus westermani]|uniref:Asparagine synthetase domain-containing protein n=1 Tax=Paragonimus westermani TaxID=34504 RepID=A0A5J4P325_9TREM|nr:uncharacterized protein DEA37_0008457 [Paragonimus westermani]